MTQTVDTVIVGGGQAGLSVSYWLRQRNVDHVVLEQARIAESWRSQRWDSFCLVTPNWQCRLPNFPYAGPDPRGFMPGADVVAYIEDFARSFDPPLRTGVRVEAVEPAASGRFSVETSDGVFDTQHVVLAIGGYHRPIVPGFASRLPTDIVQLDAGSYRNPQALPEGSVLVVGSGQSGCQIAEDLHLAGRTVHLCLGNAPRSPRVYRGRDVVEWLEDLGHYERPIDSFEDPEAVRSKTNHYVTGRDGGREIDLRARAREGMRLHGFLEGAQGNVLRVAPDVAARLDEADATYLRIRGMIDTYIAEQGIEAPTEPAYAPVWSPATETTTLDLSAEGIQSIVWCIGFRGDFSFVKLPVLDERGRIRHRRGVTPVGGLFVVGLPWLHTWGSGRLGGVGADAAYIAEQIAG